LGASATKSLNASLGFDPGYPDPAVGANAGDGIATPGYGEGAALYCPGTGMGPWPYT